MKISLRSSRPKSVVKAPPLNGYPILRIIIGNEADDRGSCEAKATWHPEDNLKGCLQISSLVCLDFDEILVRFDGRSL
jgi:hypothetical protein